MSTVWLIQHEPDTPPGTVLEWLHARGEKVRHLQAPELTAIPKLADDDRLIVLGGSMNTDEEALYPWMTHEKALIREAVRRGLPYLGICLGAQLYCEAIGGQVQKMSQWEVGWWPVTLQGAKELPVFHWHRYECLLPQEGAEVLADSRACPVQMYRHGRQALCFQFHPETDLAWIKASLGPEGTQGLQGFVQTPEQMLQDCQIHQPAMTEWFFGQLDEWASR